jgi:hypothetical protein
VAEKGAITSFAAYYDGPMDASGAALWLNLISRLYGRKLLRVKGVLNVDGKPVAIHVVQMLVHEPISLEDWPSDDRHSRLVFIGCGITRAEIEKTFDAFSFQRRRFTRDRHLDVDAYRQFARIVHSFVDGSENSSSARSPTQACTQVHA